MPDNVPTHIACIMDGNGRWANSRGLPRIAGHRQGANTTREFVKNARDLGIAYITLYAFSSENWQRDEQEVSGLMTLLGEALVKERPLLDKLEARLKVIGDRSRLSLKLQQRIADVEEATKDNDKLTVTLALSYGGRDSIIRAIAAAQQENSESITEDILFNHLETNDITEPDLLIRTGGEQRLSNFLLWEMAYTELYFCDTLWPDFNKQALVAAIEDFNSRERRYGNAVNKPLKVAE